MLCLANSYKCGGRCIAGIQLNKLQKGHFTIVRDPNTKGPKWVRPISHHNDTGEIPNQEAWGIPVLSIIEITNPQPHPSTSHSEDIYYEKLICIDDPFVKPTMATLDLLIDTQHKLIFGNRGKAVTPENFQLGDYSVMLVKAINAEIYLESIYPVDEDKEASRDRTNEVIMDINDQLEKYCRDEDITYINFIRNLQHFFYNTIHSIRNRTCR